MEIKLSDINSLKKAQGNLTNQVVTIALALILGIATWYILKSISTVLVIKKDGAKKNCDFNYK